MGRGTSVAAAVASPRCKARHKFRRKATMRPVESGKFWWNLPTANKGCWVSYPKRSNPETGDGSEASLGLTHTPGPMR